jgi:hypothetical protein
MWGGGGAAPRILNSAPDGGEWSASIPDRLTAGEEASSMHWTGGWLLPRVGLDAVSKRKISCLCSRRESNPRSSNSCPNHYTGALNKRKRCELLVLRH